MTFESVNQIWIFLSCVVLGAGLGFWYQLSHLFNVKNKIVCAISDVIFCVGSFALLGVGFLYICCGSLRWYSVLAVLVGFFLYAKTIAFYIDTVRQKLYNFFTEMKLKKVENESTEQE